MCLILWPPFAAPGDVGSSPGWRADVVPNFREIELPEVTLRAAIEGEGPLVVMVHGFPESWYSWRHQMGPVAAAGFTARAIVWNPALIRPDRVRAVAGLSVPYLGVPKRSFMDLVDTVFTSRGKFFYKAWFQNVGPA